MRLNPPLALSKSKDICRHILIPFKPDESSAIAAIIAADYTCRCGVGVNDVFFRASGGGGGLPPVSLMRVFSCSRFHDVGLF